MTETTIIEKFRAILESEANAILQIPIDDSIDKAVFTLLNCKGKVFTTGLGKAGYVAQKAASTFCTTGTPSVFIHPADASHGDIGVVAQGDVIIAFSNSGNTREVLETVHLCKQLGIESIITITSHKESPLAKESTIALELGHISEACPFGFTPSASTAAMLAISDALALVTMQERGFTKEQFALRHHGGYLGQKSREALNNK